MVTICGCIYVCEYVYMYEMWYEKLSLKNQRECYSICMFIVVFPNLKCIKLSNSSATIFRTMTMKKTIAK